MTTPRRLTELETLRSRLRRIVFEADGTPRGEKATRTLRAVRARISEAEAPGRQAQVALARAAKRTQDAYLSAALAHHEAPDTEREAQAELEVLCGGVARGFRLLDLLQVVRDEATPTPLETSDPDRLRARLSRRFALRARTEGFAPEAVRALLAFEGR